MYRVPQMGHPGCQYQITVLHNDFMKTGLPFLSKSPYTNRPKCTNIGKYGTDIQIYIYIHIIIGMYLFFRTTRFGFHWSSNPCIATKSWYHGGHPGLTSPR